MNYPPENKHMNQDEFAQAIQSSEPRWVKGKGYRCLAILGPEGKWRSFSTGDELKDVVEAVLE